jgi:hypothetical protein
MYELTLNVPMYIYKTKYRKSIHEIRTSFIKDFSLSVLVVTTFFFQQCCQPVVYTGKYFLRS